MDQLINRFVTIIPKLFLTVAIIFCLYVPFSHWAINAELLGRHDMGLALFFSFSFPAAIYISCFISVMSLLMALFYRKRNNKSYKIVLFSAIVSILPIMYLLALDFF